MTLKNFTAADFADNGKMQRAESTKNKRPAAQASAPASAPAPAPIDNSVKTEDDVPSGTVPEILSWVGEDKDRAQKALDAEKDDDKPRKGLVKSLEEILDDKSDEDSDKDSK